MAKHKYDFSGYATKVGKKCSDGRTILQDAFQDSDGKKVPLVYQHLHNDPNNILGHAILENRKDGVYAYCSFNNSESGQIAKELVAHGDITALSIYANSLVEKGKNVVHGVLREVSLVIAGANPEAYIDNIVFAHGDGTEVTDETEAIICAEESIELPEAQSEELSHAATKTTEEDKTLGDIFDTLNDEQKTLVYAMVHQAFGDSEDDSEDAKHSNIKGDKIMKKNVFDQTIVDENDKKGKGLSHSDIMTILETAKKNGSLKQAFNDYLAHGDFGVREAKDLTHSDLGFTGGASLKHASYGIENIEYLFPEARNVTNTPTMIKRNMDWVRDVFSGAHNVPFSRIRSVMADITGDDARARGYVKGNRKIEEVITLLKRVTTPQTVYKKQKLDRDDIVDIVDMDVVAWLRGEMRMMLEEEIARAQLVGDGRSSASDDKIKEDHIRPIYTDDDLYSVKVKVPSTTGTSQMIDAIILARKNYKGSGNPAFFSTADIVGDMLLLKDTNGRRIYNTLNDLAAALRVSKIVEVPVMEGLSRTDEDNKVLDLIGIVVNMNDYYIGADKGGAINLFDDFDIDYNQYKYLIETRISGALVLPGSALVIEKEQA